jgi:hypothetical protein
MAAVKKIQRSFYLPPDLVRWLKLHAAQEGQSASDIVARALEGLRNGSKPEHTN